MAGIMPIGNSLSAGATILLAHIGFTLLQIGLCRPKNSSSVIINNVFSVGVCGLIYWAVGYAFAFGPPGNAFISCSRWFLANATGDEFLAWYWHFALASMFLVIANGGFLERLRFWIYPLFALIMGGFFFPVASHWAWQIEGWLFKGFNNTVGNRISFQDIGGAGVIHVSAGGAALIGGILLGPRPERVDLEGKFIPLGGETNVNIFVGGFLAVVGLTAKNMAVNGAAVGITLVNSILASVASGVTAFLLKRSGFCGDNWNTKTLVNAVLTGMVAVSASPQSYHPYGGFIIGVIAGLVYIGWNVTMAACNIDDAADTIAVHLGGGLWGVLLAPMFNKTNGILYHGNGTSFQIFGWSVLGGVAFFVWSGLATFLIFIGFTCSNYLKYDKESKVHEIGIDVYIHEEPAYPKSSTYSIQDEKTAFDIMTDTHNGVKGIGDYRVASGPLGYQNEIYDTNGVRVKKGVEITEEKHYWQGQKQSHPMGQSTAIV